MNGLSLRIQDVPAAESVCNILFCAQIRRLGSVRVIRRVEQIAGVNERAYGGNGKQT